MANSDAYKRTIKGRAVTLMSNARARCKNKNVEIFITQEWVEKHLVRGTCELTGIPFSFEPPPKGVTRRWDAPSLDRISKHKPYTEENTRVILWAVNCALAEYGTEVMLPILKAMIKGIEDAQALSATPLSTGDNQQGEVYPELGSFSATWTGQNSDYPYGYSGTISGQNIDHSTQESSGNSMGLRGYEVATSTTPQSEQDNWQLNPTYGWIEL